MTTTCRFYLPQYPQFLHQTVNFNQNYTGDSKFQFELSLQLVNIVLSCLDSKLSVLHKQDKWTVFKTIP